MVKKTKNNELICDRKRGRPTGKNRTPLSKEERKERNACYERVRRQLNAAALRDLAEVNGLDLSSNQMVILAHAAEFIKRKQKEKRKLISLEDMRRQNQSLEKQIADCQARLEDSDDEAPSNAAEAESRRNTVKEEAPEELPEKIPNEWLDEWLGELPEGLLDDMFEGGPEDLLNEGPHQEGLELPIKVPKAKKPRVGRAGQGPAPLDTPPRTDSSSRPSSKDSAEHKDRDAGPATPQSQRVPRLLQPAATAAPPPTRVAPRIKECALMGIFTDIEKRYDEVKEYMGFMQAECDGTNCKCQLYPWPDT